MEGIKFIKKRCALELIKKVWEVSWTIWNTSNNLKHLSIYHDNSLSLLKSEMLKSLQQIFNGRTRSKNTGLSKSK